MCTFCMKVTKIRLFRLFVIVTKFSRGQHENKNLMINFSVIRYFLHYI
jgi:hypothetical protein